LTGEVFYTRGVRRGPLALLASLVLAGVGTASAGVHITPSPLATSLSVSLSSRSPGARPVAVTLKVHAELQCGRLTAGTLVFRFPAAERLPKTIAAGDATISGHASAKVTVEGRTVSIVQKPRTGVMCDVIAPGVVTVLLSKDAGLGNPASPGLYTVSLLRGTNATNAQFRVR
jgi:hypothetical protein